MLNIKLSGGVVDIVRASQSEGRYETFLQFLGNLMSVMAQKRLPISAKVEVCRMAFDMVLSGKGNVDLSLIDGSMSGAENLLLEVEDYIQVYLPQQCSDLSLWQLSPNFLPVGETDSVVGVAHGEEQIMYLSALRTATEACHREEQARKLDVETWQAAAADGFAPIAHLYWVFFWGSVIWRLPEAHSLLKRGEIDLEVREGWRIVQLRPARLKIV